MRPWKTARSVAARARRLAALPLLLAVLVTGRPASAGSDLASAASDGDLGLSAGVLSAAYVPFKVAVAATGFLVGGATWLMTGFDPEPAHSILRSSAGGDWLVTQDHLRGRDDFTILGAQRRNVAARSEPERPTGR